MKVLVWGLGHVGSVTAACLASHGHDVVGIERDPRRVERLNAGIAPVNEPGLDGLVADAVARGTLRAETHADDGVVTRADVSLVCVGVSAPAGGAPDDAELAAVVDAIGSGLRRRERYHVVAVRGTVPVGTLRRMVTPRLEAASGASAGPDFGVVMNPDFTRETSAVEDFLAPPYTVIGQLDDRAGASMAEIYRCVTAPIVTVGIEEAELLKLATNAFHALKIGFANEVGRLSQRLGVDAWSVMDLIRADWRLNASPAYLEPGFAFGGSCLPKDLRILTRMARDAGARLPILDALDVSNSLQIDDAYERIRALGVRRVAVLGLGYKRRSDDVRASPSVALVCRLVRDGFDISVYDPVIPFDDVMSGRRADLERELPGVRHMLCESLPRALENREAVIVTQQRRVFRTALDTLPDGVVVVDLVRRGEAPSAFARAARERAGDVA